MKKVLILLIKIYQKTLSPDHGFARIFFPQGVCKFFPSCSEYALSAIKKNGSIKGLVLAILRIIRCNPFSRGGWDPI